MTQLNKPTPLTRGVIGWQEGAFYPVSVIVWLRDEQTVIEGGRRHMQMLKDLAEK